MAIDLGRAMPLTISILIKRYPRTQVFSGYETFDALYVSPNYLKNLSKESKSV